MSTLDDNIAAAEAALQKLMTGTMRQEVEYNGQRVAFTPVDVDRLRAYINDLKAQSATCDPVRGAIGFVF